jgi:hypothetical protein
MKLLSSLSLPVATWVIGHSSNSARTSLELILNSESISRFINDALNAIKNKENVVARNSIQNINDPSSNKNSS